MCSRALVEAYLRDMADTDRSLARQISEILELIRQYGPEDVAGVIEKAAQARAFVNCRLTGQCFLTFAPLRCSEVRDRHPAAAGRDVEGGDWPCHLRAGVGTFPGDGV